MTVLPLPMLSHLEQSSPSCARPGEKAYFSILENTDNTTPLPELIFPILSSGDAIGSVILCGKDRESLPGDTEKKLLQVAATYLGREMEN